MLLWGALQWVALWSGTRDRPSGFGPLQREAAAGGWGCSMNAQRGGGGGGMSVPRVGRVVLPGVCSGLGFQEDAVHIVCVFVWGGGGGAQI